MINKIAYLSFPYNVSNPESQKQAVAALQWAISDFSKRYPEYTCVNALFSVYENPDVPLEDQTAEDYVLSVASTLISACDLFVWIKAPRYEHSKMIFTELSYATVLNKPIVYEDY